MKFRTLNHRPNAKGCRQTGGGRKNKFVEFWEYTKVYTGVERLLGHQSDPSDVLQEFTDPLTKRVALYKLKRTFTELTVEEG